MNGAGYQDILLVMGGVTVKARILPTGAGAFDLELPTGRHGVAAAEDADGVLRLRVDGRLRRLRAVRDAERVVVVDGGRNHPVTVVDALAPPRTEAAGDGRLSSPIPARVVRVLVAVGDAVKRGAALIVLEAMKMELTLSAPSDGVVETLRCAEGDMIEEGAALVTFKAEAGA